MNPKINELMKEANLQPYYEGQEKDIEKFAGLIIKECVEYLRTTDFSEVTCGPNAATETAAMDLLNLFGIQ